MAKKPYFRFTPPEGRKTEPRGVDKLLIFFIILLIFLVSCVGLTLVNASTPLTMYVDGVFDDRFEP